MDEEEDIGARYRIDLGRSHERVLEAMYFDFDLASTGVTPQQFESAVRDMFQTRLAFINAYGIATLLYVSLTTDAKEMGRMSRREQRVLRSQQRRLPYMTYPKYMNIPNGIFGILRHVVRQTIAKFLHI